MVMPVKEKIKRNENRIWALVFSALLCLLVSVLFDFYYDLNDDVLMKDILAGVYTGEPESRNIQMLFPLSWALSLLYRLAGNLPWYGIFLCGCQFLSIYLLTERLLGFFSGIWSKAVAVCTEGAVLLTLFLRELVFVQYTFTCAMLAAAAAFLFLTAPKEQNAGAFLRQNLPCILLALTAYLLRSEMLLLLLPLLCTAGFARWMAEKAVWTKENVKKYFLVFGVLLLGIGLGQGIHMLAYGSAEWKAFTAFFDNRTELYDFQYIPSYEGNESFYESIGLTESRQALLENYNFGIDGEIDAACLGKVADYAGELKNQWRGPAETLKQALTDYRYRIFHETDYPWNLLAIGLYFAVLIVAVWNRHFRYILELLLLGTVRTGLWMFILYRGRSPERITHSLYLVEIVVLLGMLLWEGRRGNRLPFWTKICVTGLLLLFGLAGIQRSWQKTETEYLRREEVNLHLLALQDYVEQYPDNFYFLDVFSTVAYSEKMFAGVDNSLANCDLMGGWAVKSPLTEKKLSVFSISSMEEGLLYMDNVFVVVKEPQGNPTLEEWMSAYYAGKGISVSLDRTDTVSLNGETIFGVYTLSVPFVVKGL